MASKLTIGGFKLSQALVQVNLTTADGQAIMAILERLSHGHINLVYVTMGCHENQWTCTCAVSAEAWPETESLIGQSDGKLSLDVVSPVGTLTVFPHQSRLDLLEGILDAFGQAGLPVHSVASSLSTLTLATDFHRLDTATGLLLDIAQLPGNPAPADSQLHIRQI